MLFCHSAEDCGSICANAPKNTIAQGNSNGSRYKTTPHLGKLGTDALRKNNSSRNPISA